MLLSFHLSVCACMWHDGDFWENQRIFFFENLQELKKLIIKEENFSNMKNFAWTLVLLMFPFSYKNLFFWWICSHVLLIVQQTSVAEHWEHTQYKKKKKTQKKCLNTLFQLPKWIFLIAIWSDYQLNVTVG